MKTKDQFSILLIEDSPSDADLFQEMLLEVPAIEFKVVIAARLSEGLKHLATVPVNLILLDLSLPDSHGLETFRRIQAAAAETPVIVLTGLDDETLALKAVSLGAQDYLIKDNVGSNLLARAIRYSIERKRLTNTLHQHEQEFKTLVENAPDVISRVDQKLRRVYVNPAIEKATGIPPSEYIGKTYQDLGVIGESISLWDTAILAVFESGQEHIIEYAAPSPNGWHYYQTRIVPEFSDDGSIRTVLSIARDITERKQMEIALQESDERYQALFERSLDAVYLHDFSGRFLDANPAALNLLEYNRDEIVKLNFQSLLSADEMPLVLEMFLEIQEKGTQSEVREFKLRTKNGQEIVVETMASLIFRDGKAHAIQGVARDVTAKRQAQEALRESERFAHSVVDALTANIAILDETGQIVAINRGWRLFAESNGPLQGKAMEGANYLQVCDNVQGDDAADARAFAGGIRMVLQGQQDEFSLEYACPSPAEQRWFVGRVTRFPGDGPTRIVVAHENITERKKTENELASLYYATSFLFKSDSLSNLGYQVVQAVITAFDYVHCALLLKDKISGEIVRFTRSGVYEVAADQPLSVDGHGLVPLAFRSGKIVYSPDVLADELYFAGNPRSRSELVIPLKTANGLLGVLDLQSITLDAFNQRDQRILTAFAERAAAAIENMQLYEEINRHAAELEWRVSKRTAELQRSKDRVEAILNHSSDVILLIDREGLIQQSNFTFYQEFGYQSGEEFGKPLAFLVDGDQTQSVLDALDKVLHHNQPQRLEIVTHRRDGRSFDADMALSPIRVQDGENIGVICSLRDITTRKQLESDLHVALAVEKELNELKTRFVAMVSHDFRTPLSVILSSAEILEHYNDRLDAEQKTRHFDKIGTQVSRMISLLNDVLTINRADANHLPFHPAPLNLDQFCHDMAEEFQNTIQMKHTLAYSCSGEARIVVADEKLLQQAVINLLTNAFKYSPEGSTVEFNLSFDMDNAVIRIKDKGIGIPEADQPHLFEAFHRAGNVGDVEGTGLGLAIVKRSIEAHSGKITVESQVGAGTTFVVSLPYLEPEKIAL